MVDVSPAQCLAWGEPCSSQHLSGVLVSFCARDYLGSLLRVTLVNAQNKIQRTTNETDFIETLVKIFSNKIRDLVINMLLH